MAQLITMRQRIKAVETIKKITHAMRLISMSSHTRLRHKKAHLEAYKKAFQTLWGRIAHVVPLAPESEKVLSPHADLVILVSSQKGLCGTFNTTLFKFFELETTSISENTRYIGIGKYASDYLKQQQKDIVTTFPEFSSLNFVSIAQTIAHLVTQTPGYFSTVTVYSNYQKSFFVQKPQRSQVYPLAEQNLAQSQESTAEYIFEQSPQELSATIHHLMITVSLEELLFDSLLAEQAARFISMDNSTRNAEKLLVSMKLEYNKTRQAAITRELTELASSYK